MDLQAFPNNFKEGFNPISFNSRTEELYKQTGQILVGIEPYLGAIEDQDTLILVSPDRPLVLKDGAGFIHKSSEINIKWLKIPIDPPYKINRQVIGPFASFESAYKYSLKLNEENIPNLIAYPKDWEIWVPIGSSLPDEYKAVVFSKVIHNKVYPSILLASGNYFLQGEITIEAPDGLLFKDGIYSGPFLLRPDSYGSWTLIEKVNIENYLFGVIPHEIGANSPEAALASQAVLARTWAIANLHRFQMDGYNLCSSTQCQVYSSPLKNYPAVTKAINSTKGKILTWKGQPISAVYHATNGGVMASIDESWDTLPALYIRPKLDGSFRWERKFFLPLDTDEEVERFLSYREGSYGNNHHLFRWNRTKNISEITKSLSDSGIVIRSPSSITVLERGKSGRVIALQIKDEKFNESVVLQRDDIRRTFKFLPSTLFIVDQKDNNLWHFTGGGFGHGAGLSQAGAIDLALRGWSVERILKHYYPGTTYESFP